MINSVPQSIQLLFIGTTLLTLILFARTMRISQIKTELSRLITACMLLWLCIIGYVAYSGFLLNTELPPNFILAVLPPIIAIVIAFNTKKGKEFIDQLSLLHLTILSVVRIPVEIGLHSLFLANVLPEEMTYSGLNFDIIAGITAPLVAYFGIYKKMMGRKSLLAWNIICLGLLLTIITVSILSAPLPFQQMGIGIEQFAMMYYPFNWLPAFIVPVVLFTHFVAIRRLLKKE